MSTQRYFKLVEFAAHSGDVRCVRIGRKTAGVLVTGGDDKKVNVWAIGKTTASFSLTGHQSSVESVSFDNDEMVVAAGGSNGSIKVFELQSGRVTKSLSGHKSNVTCLAWHPYDATIISGSMDTNVKMWNLRDKEAIMTLKGHNAPVSHVRYSPDGHWVASASSDGAVKIWDVRGGRLVTDLCAPTKYEITGLEFSPTEYLLATSARDKVVRFWDLENFSNLDQTPPEATVVRNIAFHSDGRYIFSALQDGCKVWRVEPPEQHDYVDVPWSRVSDLTVSTHRGAQRLIGCSYNGTMVGLYYITLRNVRPFNEDPDFLAREQGASVDGNPYAGVGASRSNLAAVAAAAQLPPEAAMRRANLNDRSSSGAATGDSAGYQNGVGKVSGGGAAAGQPAGVARSSDRAGSSGSGGRISGQAAASAGSMLPPVSLYAPPGAPPNSNRYSSSAAAASQDFDRPGEGGQPEHAGRAASGQGAGARPAMVSVGVGVGDSLMRGQIQQQEDLTRVHAGEPSRAQQPQPRPRGYGRDPPVEVHAPPPSYPRQPQARMESPPDPHSAADQRYPWQGAPAQGAPPAGPSGLDRRGYDAGGGAQYVNVVPSDLEAATTLQSRHTMFSSAMKKRAHALSLIRNFVCKADWRGAISCARRCDDNAAFADLLAAMYERRDAFTLDLVGDVISVIDTVLSLPSDRQVQVGLDVVSLHVRYFGPIIKELCSPSARGVGIDISFEERRDRANKAKLALQNLIPKLNTLSKQSDTLGGRAHDLAGQLAQL